MRRSVPAVSGDTIFRLPTWGRSFWQDPNDGNIILLYASGNNEVDFVTSSDSGNTWSAPAYGFPVDNFEVHNNFDAVMDRNGNVHCGHRYNDSGCYSFIAKDFVSGGWSPSGVVARGFIDASDSGNLKGFNGSVEVTDTFVGPFGFADVAGPYPVARIQAKGTINGSGNLVNAYWVPNPFTSFPLEDAVTGFTMVDHVGTKFPAGAEGGYPIFTRTGNLGRAIVYMVDGTGFIRSDNSFAFWYFVDIPISDPVGNFSAGSPEASGYVSRLPFTPNMAHLEVQPVVGNNGDFRAATQTYFLLSDDTQANTNWEMMVAANESQLVGGLGDDGGSNSDVFVRVEGIGSYAAPVSETRSRAPNGLPFRDILPSNNVGYPQSSGTLVDMSVGDTANQFNIYFLSNKQDGEQTISRLRAYATRDFTGGTINGQTVAAQTNTISIGDLTSAVSGIQSWAPAGTQYVGGSGNRMSWDGFKALRHPYPAYSGGGLPKEEIVVTAGSGLDGKYRIVSWDFQNSVAAEGKEPLATWTVQHTGVITDVSGITFFQAQPLIDGFTVTGNSMSVGDMVTIDFEKETRFDRIEWLWNQTFGGSPYHGIRVYASLDGTNFEQVAEVPEGHTLGALGGTALIKLSSELDVVDPDTTINYRMVPFYARYIKWILFGTTGGTRSTREVKFYGAHSSAGEWVTSEWDREFVQPGLEYSPSPESFNTTVEGEIPSPLTTYGDFTWGVKTSGLFSLDGAGGWIGEASSFQGQTNGNGDGSAVRTARTGITTGQSGVLEAIVNVASTEITFDGIPGRTIEFDMRYNLIGDSPLLDENTATDDKIYFETVTPTGTSRIYYPGQFPKDTNDLCTTNICNYFTYRGTIPTGTNTLRWVYERGTTSAPNIVDDEGSVWIDNILGIKLVTLNSINGFMFGTNPNTIDITGESGVFGFMSKIEFTSVNAYASGSTAVGGGGSDPVFAAYGYTLGLSEVTGNVNAYTVGYLNDSVYAYAKGFIDSVNNSVNAYTITSGSFGSVLGHMQNRLNEAVNGYLLGPSGALSNVNAYLITPEFAMINGYLKAGNSGSVQVNAFLDANGAHGGINGFMFASGLPSGTVNGFLLNTAIATQVNARVAVGDSFGAYGYIKGAIAQSGNVNAWISGIGIIAQEVNAYLPSISGSISGVVNAYTKAHLVENGTVYATTVGFDSGENCGDFPLSTVPSVVIPTGNFFI